MASVTQVEVTTTGGTAGGVRIGPLTMSGSAVGPATALLLTTTPQSYVPPTGAKYLLIVPPSTNTNTLQIRSTTGGDTAIVLHYTAPTLLGCHDTPQTVQFYSNNTWTVPLEVIPL